MGTRSQRTNYEPGFPILRVMSGMIKSLRPVPPALLAKRYAGSTLQLHSEYFQLQKPCRVKTANVHDATILGVCDSKIRGRGVVAVALLRKELSPTCDWLREFRISRNMGFAHMCKAGKLSIAELAGEHFWYALICYPKTPSHGRIKECSSIYRQSSGLRVSSVAAD